MSVSNTHFTSCGCWKGSEDLCYESIKYTIQDWATLCLRCNSFDFNWVRVDEYPTRFGFNVLCWECLNQEAFEWNFLICQKDRLDENHAFFHREIVYISKGKNAYTSNK